MPMSAPAFALRFCRCVATFPRTITPEDNHGRGRATGGFRGCRLQRGCKNGSGQFETFRPRQGIEEVAGVPQRLQIAVREGLLYRMIQHGMPTETLAHTRGDFRKETGEPATFSLISFLVHSSPRSSPGFSPQTEPPDNAGTNTLRNSLPVCLRRTSFSSWNRNDVPCQDLDQTG